MAKLIITVPEKEDLEDFMEVVKEQLEHGFTQGYVTRDFHWELIN